jgi:hypothetical protein
LVGWGRLARFCRFPPYLVAETAPWKNTIRADRTTGQRRKALLL